MCFGPERVRDVELREAHLAELLPRTRLVLARGGPELVVEVAQLPRIALGVDVRQPRVARRGGETLVARLRVRGRTCGIRAVLGQVLHVAGDVVLVGLQRQPVRAERHELHAVAPERVLHPVPVHGLEVVQRRRLVQEVGVELRNLLARDGVRERRRVAEDVRARGQRDRERPVGIVDEDQRDAPPARRPDYWGRVRAAVRRREARVGVVRSGNRLVVGPGQIVLERPVLRVDRRRRRSRSRPCNNGGGDRGSGHGSPRSSLSLPLRSTAAAPHGPSPLLRPRSQVGPCSLRVHAKSTKCGAISTTCRVSP